MKSFLLSILVLYLVSLISADSGYITGQVKSSENLSNVQLNDENIADLISHGFNLLDQTPSETSKLLIENYGFSSVFQPKLINFLFMIEKKNDTNEGDSTKFDVNVCVHENSESCLLSRLFSNSNSNSIKSKLEKIYPKEKLAFFYSTYQKTISDDLKNSAIKFYLDHNKKVTFEDFLEGGKVYPTSETLESCVNSFLSKNYEFDFYSNVVYKYKTNLNIKITEKNLAMIQDFMQDVCTLSLFSKMIRNDGKPNIYAFHIQSIAQLESVLSQDEMKVVEGIWNLARKKFIIALNNKFSKEDINGQTLYVNSKTPLVYEDLIKNVEIKKSSRVLNEIPKVDPPKVKMWENTSHYQAYVWLPVVLTFVLFFSVMALVNLDFSKDTLLYAKFITSDAH